MLAFYISSSSLGGPPEVNDDRGYAAQEGTTDPRCLLISFFINFCLSFFFLYASDIYFFVSFACPTSSKVEGSEHFVSCQKGFVTKEKKKKMKGGKKNCAVL